jgi:pSer/pThr/pTyr-binding forkhead associated (FHA) protein
MRDGRTRKLEVVERDESFDAFLSNWRAIVVILSGEAAGTEFELNRPNVSIGRGAEAHWTFDDDAMSKEHAALEFVNGRIRLRDLGSMNGTRLNDSEVRAGDLKNGDRFQLGQHVFQFVLDKRPKQPKTYVLPDV